MAPIVKLIALGLVTATSYRAVPEQTKPECKNNRECQTSIGENVSQLGVAASPDLLRSGELRYGDVVWIDGVGARIVNDTTHPRLHRTLDVFVYTLAQEKKFGVKRLHAWKVEVKHK